MYPANVSLIFEKFHSFSHSLVYDNLKFLHFRFKFCLGARVGAVVEALYKPEGRGIDSRWCPNFSLT
jgi:hypothetical protein